MDFLLAMSQTSVNSNFTDTRVNRSLSYDLYVNIYENYYIGRLVFTYYVKYNGWQILNVFAILKHDDSFTYVYDSK